MTSSPPPSFPPPSVPPAQPFPPPQPFPPAQGPAYGPPPQQAPVYGGSPQGAPYAPPSYGPPQGAVPPPPPLGAFEQQVGTVPVAAWLVPLAGILAVVGACIPWFHGKATVPGRGSQSFEDSLYSFDDGRLGIIPPIILLILGIGVAGLLLGRSPRRFSRGSSHPIVSAARGSMIAGAVTLVCVLIAWFLVPSQYKLDNGAGRNISWNDALDQLHAQGVDASFSRGPQAGYFLTIAAGVLAILGGALMLAMRTKDDNPVPPAASYPPPATGWAPPSVPATAPPPVDSTPDWSTPTSYPGGAHAGDPHAGGSNGGAPDLGQPTIGPDERPNLSK